MRESQQGQWAWKGGGSFGKAISEKERKKERKWQFMLDGEGSNSVLQ